MNIDFWCAKQVMTGNGRTCGCGVNELCNWCVLQANFGKSSKQNRLSHLCCISILNSSFEVTSDIHQVNSLVEQNCQATIS